MDIDWSHVLWRGRWDALVMIWNALVTDVVTFWWFGPLLLVLVVTAGRKKLLQLGLYIAKAFAHTHAPN